MGSLLDITAMLFDYLAADMGWAPPSPVPSGGATPTSAPQVVGTSMPEPKVEPHKSPATKGDPHQSLVTEGELHQSPAHEALAAPEAARKGDRDESHILCGRTVGSPWSPRAPPPQAFPEPLAGHPLQQAATPRSRSPSPQVRWVKRARQARDIMDLRAQMVQVLELHSRQKALAAPATSQAPLSSEVPYPPSPRGIQREREELSQLTEEDVLSIAASWHETFFCTEMEKDCSNVTAVLQLFPTGASQTMVTTATPHRVTTGSVCSRDLPNAQRHGEKPAPSSTSRQPISTDLLFRLITTLRQGCFNPFDNIVMETLCLTSFFGFLRCAEFSTPSTSSFPALGLKSSDLSQIPGNHFIPHIRSSKIDQLSQEFYVFRQIPSSSTAPDL
ncbi:UNVERIFIED_CONTAM: hypothetical protein FKN15_066207 [Acipenser sinensis]